MKLWEQLSAAVLYAAFAAALLALSHRLVVRIGRRAAWALVLLPLCLPGRALLTGQVYAPIDLAFFGEPFTPYASQYEIGREHHGIFTDLYTAVIPWRQAVRYAVQHGEWPLWNPFILCGDPLAGSAQPAPYYPINALSLLLPLALAFTFGAAAQLFAAMLATFLYLRDLGCREVAALLGAVGWALSSFVAFWVEWPLGAAVSLVPLVALGARHVVRQPGWRSALLLAAGLSLVVLAGHPESVVHVVAVGGVLGLVDLAAVPRRRWGAIAGWTAAAGALALALSAIYLLPLLEALRQTMQWFFRHASTTLATAAPPADAWRRFLGAWLPSTIETSRAGEAAPLLGPLASAYAGSVLWGPAIYGLIRARWRGRFALAALGLVGLGCGAKLPWIYPLVGHLPLLSISINERLVFAGAFATAALAALGAEAWLRQREESEQRVERERREEREQQEERERTRQDAGDDAAGGPAGANRGEHAGAGSEHAGAESGGRVGAGRGDSADSAPGLAIACAASALVFCAALAWLIPRAADAGFADREIAHWAEWSLAPLFAAALVAAVASRRNRGGRGVAFVPTGSADPSDGGPAGGGTSGPGVPQRGRGGRGGSFRAALRLPAGAAAAALVALLAIQRTGELGSMYPTLPARAFYPLVKPLDALPRGSGEPWRAIGQDFQLIPNQGAFYEIEDARGYQAIFNRRFAELTRLWANPLPSWYLSIHDLDRPYLNLVNVRYAITHRRAELPGWRPVARGISSKLWENPRALPRAFVPRRVRFGVPADQEPEEMEDETDFGRLAWIAPPGGDAGPPREERNGRGWVVATRNGLGFDLIARMKQPGWAVISETAWTGWRARLDGHEVPLGIGDHAFLALAIPAGWHEGELFYRPRSFELGLALSAATAALIAVVSFARLRRRARLARLAGHQGDPASEESQAGGRGAAAAAAPAERRLGDRIAIPGDYQYRALHAGPAPQRFWHRAKLEEALALLRLQPGDRLLDAGCGSGMLAAMAAAAPGTVVLGIDANPAALEFVSRTFALPNLSFRQALVDDLDAPPASFEKIACLEVIEHLARGQGETMLAEFARLLVPGGRLVLTTPNRRSPWPLVEWLLDRLRLVPQMGGEQHEVLYDLDELRAMGERAGLPLAEHRMIDTIAPWVSWWPALARRVHRAELRLVRRHGCVMVLAFVKPSTAARSADAGS